MANLEKLFEKYTVLVYKIISKFSIPQQYKDDIQQECFMQLWKCCKNYNEKLGAKFITYAYICIENTIYTQLKKIKKHQHLQLLDKHFCKKQYNNIEIDDLLNKLSPEEVDIFKMHFYDKMTNIEIAKTVKISNQAVSNKIKKIKRNIKTNYEKENPGVRAHFTT